MAVRYSAQRMADGRQDTDFEFRARWPDGRVVVIDDDSLAMRSMTRLLRGAGFQNVRTASGGQEGLELCREGVDIVVLDLHMPELSGFQLLELIEREVSNGHHLPVLVLTGDLAGDSRRRALSLGATDFLTKPYDPSELLLRIDNLMHTRALHLEIAENNDRLEERIRTRTQELEDAHAELMVRLALAAEFRDDSTGEHTWRVGVVARHVAELMGTQPRRAKLIERAARLHDVGKIGIPDAILLKPGRLTREEFEVMKEHSTIGGNLLSGGRTEVVQLAESIARSHHERWDGSGYPSGLGGEAIPLEGRIVAVADVFDALTHQRTYKERWTKERAIDEIRKQRGRQFAPDVTDAFLVAAERGAILDIERPDDTRLRGVLPSRFWSEPPPQG